MEIYCNEVQGFIHAEEEQLRQVAIEEQGKETNRGRARIVRLRGKYSLPSDSEAQILPD